MTVNGPGSGPGSVTLLTLIFTLILLLAGCARAPYSLMPGEKAGIDEANRVGLNLVNLDQVAWRKEREQWVMSVPREPGMGALTVTPVNSVTLSRPMLVLHMPFRQLEYIRVSYGDRVLLAEVGNSGELQQARCDSCSAELLEQLKLVIVKRVDGFEVYLPADYWQEDRGQIRLRWIDAYRS